MTSEAQKTTLSARRDSEAGSSSRSVKIPGYDCIRMRCLPLFFVNREIGGVSAKQREFLCIFSSLEQPYSDLSVAHLGGC